MQPPQPQPLQTVSDPALAALRALRPAPSDLADYQVKYVAQVQAGDVLETLRAQLDDVLALMASLPVGRHHHRYAPGKWSIAELMGHLTDTERVFSLRALCFARKDPGPLPGFDEDPYVEAAGFDARGLPSIMQEFEHLRRANLALFGSFDAAAFERRGTASGRDISVRALVYLTAGHVAHHLQVLRERYLEHDAP
ncbi:MAG: DinB family protein [Planctomycetota bacterium]